jgi:hypothetical protein
MRSLLLTSSLLISALLISSVAAARADTSPSSTICCVSPSWQQQLVRVGYIPFLSSFIVSGARIPGAKSPAGIAIKLAAGFCTERCHQQFNYCQYRREPAERCARRLTKCLVNC